jgi:O-antigen ligase
MQAALHRLRADLWMPAAGLAASATVLTLYLLAAGRKPLVAILGSAALIAALYLCGNPRLLALWGFGLTLPFDLSKRLGPYIEKMGGETAFRIEISDVFLALLTAFLIQDVWTGRRTRLLIPKITWIWLAIFALGLISLAQGPFRLTVAHELARMLKVLVLFLVLANELQTPHRILHCCGGILLGTLVQSVAGITQFFLRKHFGLDLLGETGAGTLKQLADESLRTERAFRAGAFMNHPNIFGCFLAIVIPLAVVLVLGHTSLRYKLYALLCAGLGTAALIATMSRSGWLSCAVSLTTAVILMILHQGSRQRSLLALLAATAVLAVIGAFFADRIMTRLFESKEGAMRSRYEYIRTATRMIERKPVLGWGLNTYVWHAYAFTTEGARAARERYKQWLPPVHNIYYLWTAELGLTGLFIHLWLFAAILWSSVRNFPVRHPLLFAINLACFAGMLAILTDGFFSFTWRINSIMRIFWVNAAMVMAIQSWRLRHQVRCGAPPEPLTNQAGGS